MTGLSLRFFSGQAKSLHISDQLTIRVLIYIQHVGYSLEGILWKFILWKVDPQFAHTVISRPDA
jgi:hypothetical protein